MIIEVMITKVMMMRAIERAHDLGPRKDSIHGGSQIIYGMLGEEVVAEYFKDMVRADAYSHDFTCRGIRFDVKSNCCSSVPRSEFQVTIWDRQRNQDTDAYVFVRVEKTFRRAWILGWCYKDEYFGRATKSLKGSELVIGTKNPKKVISHMDGWNLIINQLRGVKWNAQTQIAKLDTDTGKGKRLAHKRAHEQDGTEDRTTEWGVAPRKTNTT